MSSKFVSTTLAIAAFMAALPLGSLPASAQQTSGTAQQTANEEVTHLDPMVVNAAPEIPPPEAWYYVQIPGMDVYSNASERATKRLLQDFENFRFGLDAAWPIKAKIRQPTTLILCAGDTFRSFVPTTDKSDKDTGRASITLVGPEHAYIVVDLGTRSMMLGGIDLDIDAAVGATYEVDYYRLLYREYVHYLLRQSEVPPPIWYEEGVAQILMKMEVNPTGVTLGKISGVDVNKRETAVTAVADETSEEEEDTSRISTIADNDFNIALSKRALLGFNQFFGVTAESPEARNPIGNNVWGKQCYAFVHMCLYASPNKYKKALETFVARSAKEPVTETLFAECFGKSYDKFLLEMRSYIGFTSYKYQDLRVQGKDRIRIEVPQLERPSEPDSARVKGDALLLAGNPGAATSVLQAAYARGARDPDFLATYGLVAEATNQDDRARRILAQATTTKTSRAAAYPAYARLLLDDARAVAEAKGEKQITPEQLASVLQPLFVGRTHRPPLKQTYELIAEAWSYCAVPPKPENFGVIAEGVAYFPRDIELVYQATRVAMRMSDAKATTALIAHGLQIAPDDVTREKFARLKSESGL